LKQRFYIDVGVANDLMEDKATHVQLIDLETQEPVKEYPLPLKFDYVIADITGNDKAFQYFFINKNKIESDCPAVVAYSNTVFPEITSGIIDKVRAWVGDVQPEEDCAEEEKEVEWNPVWTDEDYLGAIKNALTQYKGVRDVNFIRDSDTPAIRLLVQEYFGDFKLSL
jgi:hypothetical protein